MELMIICALVTPFVKLCLRRDLEERGGRGRRRKEGRDPRELLASAFALYNSQLVMKSLGVSGWSAFSQVQTF